MGTLIAIAAAFVLDVAFGDPAGMPHIVIGLGKLIAWLKDRLRPRFPQTRGGQMAAGAVMVVVMLAVPCGLCALVLWAAGLVSPWLRIAIEALVCWQCLSLRSLKEAGAKVQLELETGTIDDARRAVAGIVGRDTQQLDADAVTRATVETIAENTSDGVVAPLFFMAIGGAPLGVLYKAINTMDSMVGYKNDEFIDFGCVPAHTDDVANYLPARITGLAMCAAACPAKLSSKDAWRIWKRDRRNHHSPNSGQCESACAGALGVQLGGNSNYFGKLVEKPTLGDPTRPIEPRDIAATSRLSYWTSMLCLVVFMVLRGVVIACL